MAFTCADLASDKDDLCSENNFEQANSKWWFCTLDRHGTSFIFRGIPKESEQMNPFMKDPFTKGIHDVHFKELYHLWSCDPGWRVLAIHFKARSFKNSS